MAKWQILCVASWGAINEGSHGHGHVEVLCCSCMAGAIDVAAPERKRLRW